MERHESQNATARNDKLNENLITPSLWRQQLNTAIPQLFSGRSCGTPRTGCILYRQPSCHEPSHVLGLL